MGTKRTSKTLIYRDNRRQVTALARAVASMMFADFRLVSPLNRHHHRHQTHLSKQWWSSDVTVR
jgi:hypothetical protein